jgi:ABC-type Mn2+/Zn2+ transport system permease subunit
MKMLLVGWLVGVLVSMGGILASLKLDVPTSPAIVAGLTLTFFLLLGVKILSGASRR